MVEVVVVVGGKGNKWNKWVIKWCKFKFRVGRVRGVEYPEFMLFYRVLFMCSMLLL